MRFPSHAWSVRGLVSVVLFAGCLFESVCRLRKEGWGWLCGAQGLTTGTDCGRPNLNQGFVKTQKRRQLVHSRVCEGQKTRFARHTVPAGAVNRQFMCGSVDHPRNIEKCPGVLSKSYLSLPFSCEQPKDTEQP